MGAVIQKGFIMKVVIITLLIGFVFSTTLNDDPTLSLVEERQGGRGPTSTGCTAVDKIETCCKNDHCKEPETCSDKSGKKCIAWAKQGYCKTIQGLAENCAKSCGKCKGNGSSDDHLGSSECT